LGFAYFNSNGAPATSEASIDRVQIRLLVSVDQGIGGASTQELTSVIDLRNRNCEADADV
jgi:hypothetical protein